MTERTQQFAVSPRNRAGRYAELYRVGIPETLAGKLLPEPATLRLAREGEEVEYWGWHEFELDEWCFVWPQRALRDMCFTYGPEAEEKRGRGKRIELVEEDR